MRCALNGSQNWRYEQTRVRIIWKAVGFSSTQDNLFSKRQRLDIFLKRDCFWNRKPTLFRVRGGRVPNGGMCFFCASHASETNLPVIVVVIRSCLGLTESQFRFLSCDEFLAPCISVVNWTNDFHYPKVCSLQNARASTSLLQSNHCDLRTLHSEWWGTKNVLTKKQKRDFTFGQCSNAGLFALFQPNQSRVSYVTGDPRPFF